MSELKDPKQIILDILALIDFQENKEKFADDFLTQCLKLAIIDAIENLGDGQKKAFLEEISTKKGTDEMREVMQKHVPTEAFDKIIRDRTQKQFESYIEEILPTLNGSRKEQLLGYLSDLALLTSRV